MADLKQKEMIFGMLEVVFGLATVFTLSSTGLETSEWIKAFGAGLGCCGALIPLMMRFSFRFFTGSALPKLGEMMVMIWAMVLYCVGGVMVILTRQDSYRVGDMCYLPAALALAAAVVCIVDFIMGLCAK